MDRISRIISTDAYAARAAHTQWNSIAKPLGSLGRLETAIEKIAAVQGCADVKLNNRQVVVMCADNGVVCEGITQSDSTVTAICAAAIAEGTSNINCMAEAFGAKVTAVDAGMNCDVDHPRLLRKKTAYGTKNIASGAAMHISEAEQAISYGMDIVRDLKQTGTDIIVTGEMGIGNTTTSAAIASVLLGMPPRTVTGRGAGLDGAGLERKISVIEKAIAVNKPDADKPVELLAKLGGFDLAGITGLFLGGAVYHIPIVIDGMISAAAALLASKIHPLAREYMLASHTSGEPAGRLLLEKLRLSPLIQAEMRLGEGTGGILLLPLLDGALSVYRHSHRFENLPMERYVELK
ncbi:MAG: nicotinate-nucleotide--dimethylbenzimidazole phosphoribosyltransferase [Ruminococcus sp.]|nr:nicotinate-nucleotide--dimethylbenzimidazole phosphoribosyltransferase [Ruminococcus sp.]